MLQILKVKNRSQVRSLLEQFEPNTTTWLVSDLRTKFETQKFFLDKQGYFKDESVYRASDLWRILLRRQEPQLKVVSEAFIRTILKDILDTDSEVLQGINSSAENTILSYMNTMSSILLHPEGYTLLSKWFDENPDSASRWQNWFLRARYCMQKIVFEKRIISPKWIVNYLQSSQDFTTTWKEDLVVDLAGDLTSSEAELLKILARQVNVTVIKPDPLWQENFSYILRPYEILEGVAQQIKELSWDPSQNKRLKVHRVTSALAEVKWAVHRVRSWLDQGVSPEEVAIIAPDIESYWPVLRLFLAQEGIPVQKGFNTRVQSFAEVTIWLAQIRSRTGGLQKEDLELAYFSQEKSQLKYEKFKGLFAYIYSDEDLIRNENVQQYFSKRPRNLNNLTAEEFLITALDYWSDEVTPQLEAIIREFFANTNESITLSWQRWLSYLESICSQKEETLSSGQEKGIHCTKIQSASALTSQYRIFIGLAEENLKKNSQLQLMSHEYFEIQKDFGFTIENPDVSSLDFELRYLVDCPAKEDHLLFGSTDFSGKLLAPAVFWIESEKKETLSFFDESELLTLWDIKQRNIEIHNSRLQEDLGLATFTPVIVEPTRKISPTAVEDFNKCAFVYAAKRVFRLEDYPDVDLDVDHRTRGVLAHALLQSLVSEPFSGAYDFDQVENSLEKVKQSEQLILADERIWKSLKARHHLLAKRFLEAETQRRMELSKGLKTLYKEIDIKFFYVPSEQRISLEPIADSWTVSCRIDRIDSDGSGFVVLDYKASGNSSPAVNTWISKRKLQMLFYIWAVEGGVLKPDQGEAVLGGFYYNYKTFKLKGFGIEDQAGRLYPSVKRNKGTIEEKEELMSQFTEVLNRTLEQIEKGEFAPVPLDEKDCEKCKWSQICRAPHLM